MNSDQLPPMSADDQKKIGNLRDQIQDLVNLTIPKEERSRLGLNSVIIFNSCNHNTNLAAVMGCEAHIIEGMDSLKEKLVEKIASDILGVRPPFSVSRSRQ